MKLNKALKPRRSLKRPEKKKKNSCYGQCKSSSFATTGANAILAEAQQKKKKKTWDASKITCYSCNTKGYFASNHTEKTKNLAAVSATSTLVTTNKEASAEAVTTL